MPQCSGKSLPSSNDNRVSPSMESPDLSTGKESIFLAEDLEYKVYFWFEESKKETGPGTGCYWCYWILTKLIPFISSDLQNILATFLLKIFVSL